MLDNLRRRLLAPIQLPGWTFILIYLFTEIPIWHDQVRFWADAIVKYAPYLSGIITFLLSAPGRWMVLGTGLIWIAIVASGKDSERKPHLSYTDQSGGLYDLQPNMIGFYLIVANDEIRYQSTAHHIKATIEYRHSLGDKLKVKGVWITRNNTPREYKENASLGMNESQCLLIVIWPNSETKFYAPGLPFPPQLDPNLHLEFGEWKVEIKLEGNNIEDKYKGVLTLVPGVGPVLKRI